MSNEKIIKVVICGESNSGKSTFVKYHKHEIYDENSKPTVGVEVHYLNWIDEEAETNIRFNIWDCSGLPKYYDLLQTYWEDADAAIVFYCGISISVYTVRLINDLRSKFGKNFPIIVCKSKFDLDGSNTNVTSAHVTNCFKNIIFHALSTKNKYNVDDPFMLLSFHFSNVFK